MFWNTIKVAGIPALFTASVLGTAVLAQQGRSPSNQPASHSSQENPKKEPELDPVHRPSQDKRALDREQKRKQEMERRLKGEQTTQKPDREWLDSDPLRLYYPFFLRAVKKVDGEYKQIAVGKRTAHLRDVLAQRYDLDFPQGIPLEEFLKAIKKATTKEGDSGIPIYVNPRGLQEAQIRMDSKVYVSKGQPLGETLRSVLNSTGLSYELRDGFLAIDSRIGIVESRLGELDGKLDQILDVVRKRP
jgi:hypothetical protein